MYIHEAIAATTRQKPFITRDAWAYLTRDICSAAIKIQATNSPDCCIIESATDKALRPWWHPTAEDLAAKDWRTTF